MKKQANRRKNQTKQKMILNKHEKVEAERKQIAGKHRNETNNDLNQMPLEPGQISETLIMSGVVRMRNDSAKIKRNSLNNICKI